MANRRRTKEQKRILKARDEMLCGIHLGGCGKRVRPNEISVDHIVPQGLCSKQPEKRIANLQLMCKKCDNEVKAGQWSDIPKFNCTCHYFQIENENLVLVYEDMRTEYSKYNAKHVVFEGIIDHPERIRASWQKGHGFSPGEAQHVELLDENSNVVSKMWVFPRKRRMPIDGKMRDVVGWFTDPVTGRQFGHRIPCVSREQVQPFNVEQRNHGPFRHVRDVRFYLPEFRGRAYDKLEMDELPEGSNLFDSSSLPSGEIEEIVSTRINA